MSRTSIYIYTVGYKSLCPSPFHPCCTVNIHHKNGVIGFAADPIRYAPDRSIEDRGICRAFIELPPNN